MKDLKENMQKNNMKKLVLSAVLGVFCYCTNNAMEGEEEVNNEEQKEKQKNQEEENKEEITNINKVLDTMLFGQMDIEIARIEIQPYKKKIYSAIKNEEKKVTKKNVLDFIKKQYTTDEQNQEGFDDNINKIKQYFHLEEIKKDNDECNEGNLTEIFWEKVEEGEAGEIGGDEEEKIKGYFQTIIETEKQISKAFQEYYATIKANHQEKGYEDILKGIMKDCCDAEEISNLETNVIKNLRKLLGEGKKDEEAREFILTKIKKRITLNKNITEKNFISFLKQKIGIKEKEEEKIKETEPAGKVIQPAKGGCCPCCDCWEKKKTLEVIEV